jgi:hypothetical protein
MTQYQASNIAVEDTENSTLIEPFSVALPSENIVSAVAIFFHIILYQHFNRRVWPISLP